MDEQSEQFGAGAPSPWARPTTPEEPARPLWLDPPASPPLRETPAGPPPPRPPNPLLEPPAPERPRGDGGWLKPAIAGAVVGALVAAGVAGGIVAATRDDGPSVSPSVTRASSRLSGDQLDVASVLQAVEHGVVTINIQGATQSRVFESAGTGMIIEEDGLVLTNAHVIASATRIRVSLADGRQVNADLVGSSPDNDLALVQIRNPSDLEPVRFGSSSALQVGDDVVAVGNALNLGATPTVTTGIVSALGRNIDDEEQGIQLENLIQTDAAINRGNSGGPLVNARGEVIGINTAVAAQGQNIGFAISIDTAKALIERLKTGRGEVKGGVFLGVRTFDVSQMNEDARLQLGIEADEGAVIQQVIPGSGADAAGLRPGDVITAVDGRSVRSATDVGAIVGDHEPGETLEIRYERDGESRTTRATLGATEVSQSGG